MVRPAYDTVRFDSAECADQEGALVRRWDVGEISAPQRTPEGFVRTEGVLTRAGVFDYTRPDGSKFKELRHPDEVFDRESLKSFSLVPLTNDHPAENLNPETVKAHQTGSIGTPWRDGDVAKADILITDSKAIADATAGKTGLSCGYSARVFDAPGTYVDASGVEHHFDTVQTRIRGNHVAQTSTPRAGDVAKMRMDSADAVMRAEPAPAKEPPNTLETPRQDGRHAEERANMEMVKITVNGQTFEVAKEVAARMDALAAAKEAAPAKQPDTADASALLKKELEEARGQAAAMKAELEKSRHDEAEKAKRASKQNETKETLLLYARAAPVLGKSVDDLIVMDQVEIMRAVVAKEAPGIALDGKSEDFVRGIFLHVTAPKTDTAAALNAIVGAGDAAKTAGAVRQDGDLDKKVRDARARDIERLENAWKPKEATQG